MTMLLERLQDLSIYYYLTDLFTSYPTVEIFDGYPDSDLVIPSISIVNEDINFKPFELGNRKRKKERLWNIDVYGSNKAQRDELVSIIINDIEDGILVYDYNEGFPPSSPSQIGTLSILDMGVRTVRIFPELVEKLYWRSSIRFLTQYNAI